MSRTRRGPSKAELEAARNAVVPDVVGPGLVVLFCGINPGLYSGAVGHHFARPGNRFFPLLYAAGFSPRLLAPEEDAELVALGLGITNVVARTTASAAELTGEELAAGGAILRDKVARLAPAALVVLGIGAYAAAFGARPALGRQEESWGRTAVFVVANPSGLQAHYPFSFLVEALVEVRESVGLPDRREAPGA